jgi:hypothetical protein
MLPPTTRAMTEIRNRFVTEFARAMTEIRNRFVTEFARTMTEIRNLVTEFAEINIKKQILCSILVKDQVIFTT